jgi:ribosomal protein S27E
VSAQQVTLWQLHCDECGDKLADPEYGSDYVDDNPERLREIAEDANWSRDGDNDLCPTCTCAHDGHERRSAANGTYVYCERCDTTLLEAQTAEPKAAYL